MGLLKYVIFFSPTALLASNVLAKIPSKKFISVLDI
jgi:hypothetical protein